MYVYTKHGLLGFAIRFGEHPNLHVLTVHRSLYALAKRIGEATVYLETVVARKTLCAQTPNVV